VLVDLLSADDGERIVDPSPFTAADRGLHDAARGAQGPLSRGGEDDPDRGTWRLAACVERGTEPRPATLTDDLDGDALRTARERSGLAQAWPMLLHQLSSVTHL